MKYALILLMPATPAVAGEKEEEALKARIAQLERERRMQLNYDYARAMWWSSAGQIGTTWKAATP